MGTDTELVADEITLVKPVSDARAIALQEGAPHHEEAAETETSEARNPPIVNDTTESRYIRPED